MGKRHVLGYPDKDEEKLLVTNLLKKLVTSSNLDAHETFKQFLDELCELLDINWSAITLTYNNTLYFLALSSKIGSAWQAGERIPIEGTGTEWVITNKKTIVESDISQESRFVDSERYLSMGIRSIAWLPLVTEAGAIGSLITGSCKPNTYKQGNTTLLEQLTYQITTHIKHSRFFAEFREKTRTDELTGLLNRSSLEEEVFTEIKQHSRYAGVFSLIIFDIDSFTDVNNKYGYQVGDSIIKDIGVTLKRVLRNNDQVFRCGSDEFAIILPNTPIDAAEQVSSRLQKTIASTTTHRNIPITVSIGLAIWPNDGLVENEIISAAQTALDSAKLGGGNQMQSFPGVQMSLDSTEVIPQDIQDSELLNSIYALAAIVDARFYNNRSHWRKVKECVTEIAKVISLEPAQIEKLQVCALLHDIGKIAISDKLINKRGGLRNKEWEIIKSHPQVGANILSQSAQLAPYIPGVLYHHEWYDGSGYPKGLKGNDIPIDARIIAIADSFAAMTSDRSYSDALTPQLALEEIRERSGTQFDPALVEAFTLCVKDTLL